MDDMQTPTLDALPEAIQRRLKAAGVESLDDVPVADSHTETPEQAAERIRLANASRSAKWWEAVPATYREATLESLEARYQEPIQRWVRDRKALNLVLAGEIGTGKTHAAYAIGNYAVSRGSWAIAWHVHDLLEAMRPDGDPTAYDKATRASLLVLDDLGAAKPTDWAIDTMTTLIGARVAAERRTVFTTNLTSDSLRDLWGGRMLDRIVEASASVLFTGPSRRKAAW